MTSRRHLALLLQATVVWVAFWLVGLPDYYQQYSPITLGILSTVLSLAFCLFAFGILLRTRAAHRMSRALWLSFYYTVPFAFYDWLYCGVYLGHGADYPAIFWYLTIFYFTLWLTFVPVAWMLNRAAATPR